MAETVGFKSSTDSASDVSSSFRANGIKVQAQAPLSLNYFPENLHSVKKEDCIQFNARIMKNIMKNKMGKNQSFVQAKML